MSVLKWKAKRLLQSVNLGYPVPLSLEEKLHLLERDPAWKTVELPVDGNLDMLEEILVTEKEPGRLRIASSPGMVRGLAAGDVIVLDPETSSGYRLLRHGGNVGIHVFCDAGRRDEIQAALTRVLGQIGGGVDGTMGETGLCYTVAVAAGFSVIEGAMERVVGEEWSFSNVPDPETGKLLNWWLGKNGKRKLRFG